MSHRVFLAINLPEGIKKELQRAQKEINEMFPEELSQGLFKWVPKDNLHLTLQFIGYIREQELQGICQTVKQVAASSKPFSLRLQRVCYGPPRKMPPRLIWVELEQSKELMQLVEKLGAVEKRPFSPHVTLARIRTWQWKQIEPEERPEIEQELDLSFEVKSIEVMESKLKRSGPEYTALFSSPLKSGNVKFQSSNVNSMSNA